MNQYKNDGIITMCDVDFSGKMNVAQIMSLFQHAVTLHTGKLGVDSESVMRNIGAKWVITRARFEISRHLSFGDEYTVRTWPLRAKPLRFGRSFVLESGGVPAAVAYTDWCLLDAKNDAPMRSSNLTMPIDEYLTDTVITGKFSMAREEFSQDDIVYSRVMCQSDIDINRHVNNISYIRFALDCFSTEELSRTEIKSFEMYYLSQCYEGQTLTLYRKNGCIEGRCNDVTVFRCTVNK